MKYQRICINISGYAVVGGETDEEIQNNILKLSKSDFDWEPVTRDVLEDHEVVEDCGPNGEVI